MLDTTLTNSLYKLSEGFILQLVQPRLLSSVSERHVSGVPTGPPPLVVELVQRRSMQTDSTLNLHAEQTETRVGEKAKQGRDHRAPIGPRSAALGT